MKPFALVIGLLLCAVTSKAMVNVPEQITAAANGGQHGY